MLSKQKTKNIPNMGLFDPDCFDPDVDNCPFLPFNCYAITGTAGAGKSTSISYLHQNMNCLVTGATMVAAQNLSQNLKTYCPTIYSAFGFKSRHINMIQRSTIHTRSCSTIETIQKIHISKYWPIISDIVQEFKQKKQRGLYKKISIKMMDIFNKMHYGQLWTTNVIIIDEAGTLSTHILSTIVFFYWFYNSWLETPQYRKGLLPCIVTVGSPTQTDAFQSTFNHYNQSTKIQECDNILTSLISVPSLSNYVNIQNNWALFINNKRCTDPQFGHLLKVLEYGLPVTNDIILYLDRFVVSPACVLNPEKYVGWTRLFLSHSEVKSYLSNLHNVLTYNKNLTNQIMFYCAIECTVHLNALEEYKEIINKKSISAVEWLNKNINRLSNYSQFVDQDMSMASTEYGESEVKVTYNVTFVKNSCVSVNGKNKHCIYGYTGTYASFINMLDSETFLDQHGHEQPEYVYSFLCRLLYNGMYSFYAYNQNSSISNKEYIMAIRNIVLPATSYSVYEMNTNLQDEWTDYIDDFTCIESCKAVEENVADVDLMEDFFYMQVQPPCVPSATTLANVIQMYMELKMYFERRLEVAIKYFGKEFLDHPFSTYTCNIMIRDNIDYTSDVQTLHGLLDYASPNENYILMGYTYLNVFFGHKQADYDSKGDRDTGHVNKMPRLVIKDALGFISCLDYNVNKMYENFSDRDSLHLCTVKDFGVSSKLAMTIAKAQGLSLNRVAISFGSHQHLKPSHIYVAISRAKDSNYVVMDKNPLTTTGEQFSTQASKHIVNAMKNPRTLLVY